MLQDSSGPEPEDPLWPYSPNELPLRKVDGSRFAALVLLTLFFAMLLLQLLGPVL